MNIKVAAFTVSEKSYNTCILKIEIQNTVLFFQGLRGESGTPGVAGAPGLRVSCKIK